MVMVTECSFPYVKGGVGGVIDQMLKGLPDTKFGLIHLAWDESATRARKYDIPGNVRWVKNIYLDPRNQPSGSRPRFLPRRIFAPTKSSCSEAGIMTILEAMDAASRGDYSGVRNIYRDYLNPRTRAHDLRQILRSREGMLAFENRYRNLGMSLTRTFWLYDNFISLLMLLATDIYPDGQVYHAQTQLYAGLVAAIAAAQNGRPMVLTEHGLNIRDSIAFMDNTDLPPVEKDTWRTWFRSVGRLVYEEASYATYQFERNVQEAETAGLDRSKVRMISNGINLADFARARQRNATKSLPTNHEWTIAYAGRIVEPKGILDLIDAIEILRTKTSIRFKVDMIGPSDGSEAFLRKCEQITKKRGLAGIIKFTGPRALSEAMAEVDILVLPTHTDALPIVLLEAMASSVPVVATDVGAIMEVIADPVPDPAVPGNHVGPAGIVIPAKRPALIASAIKALMTDMPLYNACRHNGPARIEINHRADKIMAQYHELYQFATRHQKTGYCGNEATRLAKNTNIGAMVAAETRNTRLNDSNVISM